MVSNGTAATLTLSSTITGVGTIGDQYLSLNIEQGGAIVEDSNYYTGGNNTVSIRIFSPNITNAGLIEATSRGAIE